MIRRALASTLATAVLLLALAGTAHAQETGPPPAPESTVVEPSPTPTTSPTLAPSTQPSTATPTPSTTATTTAPAAPPTSITATSPSATQTPASTSHAPRPSGTGAGAAAPPGPSSSVPSPTSSTPAPPRTYNALVPWIPANDRPEIFLVAVLLMAASGTAFVVMLERRPARRNQRT